MQNASASGRSDVKGRAGSERPSSGGGGHHNRHGNKGSLIFRPLPDPKPKSHHMASSGGGGFHLSEQQQQHGEAAAADKTL